MTARPPKLAKFLCLFGLASYSQVFYSDGLSNLQELRSTSADRQKPVTQINRSKAMFRNFKVLLFVLVVIVIAGSAYAFAAANTIEASSVGSGASTVSGYSITNVEYNFATNDPTQVSSIEFDLDKAAGTVMIQLDSTAVTGDTDWDWAPCTVSTLHVTCTPTGTLLTSAIKNLNVAASSN
jgi:hypothetical protein